MAQEQGDERLRSKEMRGSGGFILADDFRHDGDDYREKVGDIKAAEFHEVSRALLEKASYPLQVAEKPSFSIVDFWMKI